MTATAIDFLDRYLDAIESKKNFTLCTVIDVRGDFPVAVGSKILVHDGGDVEGTFRAEGFEKNVIADAGKLLTAGRSKTISYLLSGEPSGRRDRAVRDEPGVDVYFEVVVGQLTLIVVGGGHVGSCLAKVAHDAGWRIVVVDDRPDFANAERFPEADEILCEDYGDALSRYPINSATYIIAVTRGHKHDEVALKAIINSPACYIGMIGSKRRVATVLRHLEEEGVAKEKLDRVWTPIGLDIGAETPEEIAVSIAAEMIMVRRGGKGGPMALKERNKAG